MISVFIDIIVLFDSMLFYCSKNTTVHYSRLTVGDSILIWNYFFLISWENGDSDIWRKSNGTQGVCKSFCYYVGLFHLKCLCCTFVVFCPDCLVSPK
jgi:hypothetical protein